MKYAILFSNQFKRSYKKCLKRGCNKALFEEVVTLLAETGTLPARYKAHKLVGEWKGLWKMSYTARLVAHLGTTRGGTCIDFDGYGHTLRFVWVSLLSLGYIYCVISLIS